MLYRIMWLHFKHLYEDHTMSFIYWFIILLIIFIYYLLQFIYYNL